jgi:hypothetical protein
MTSYYLSRTLLSILFVIVLTLLGLPWWGSALIGILILGFFLWMPHTGRYLVQAKDGVTALRRDERTQEINWRAGLNGFIGLMLGLGMLVIYYGVITHTDVPASLLSLLLALGFVIYFITDFLMRKV